jgi:tetratricopeptide (TPR) repeat protein
MSKNPSRGTPVVIFIIIICAVFLAAGILRLNDLSLYSPDSIRYVIWGTSIAAGKGFVDDTQPDPVRYVVHAPLYSVLLAPVHFFFPDSLYAAKVYTLFWGGVVLCLLFRWLSPKFGGTGAIVGTVLLLCNPLQLVYSTEALSEAPFIAFLCLILLSVEKVTDGKANNKYVLLLLMCTACIGLLREAGVAVTVSVLICLLMYKQYKRFAMTVLLSAVMVGAWYVRNQILVGATAEDGQGNVSLVFRHFVTPPDASIISELAQRMWLSFTSYAHHLGGMVFYPLHGSGQVNLALEPLDFSVALRSGIILTVTPVMIWGMYTDLKTPRLGYFRLLLFAGYVAAILLYPVHDVRFLFPLLPVMIYYFLNGIGEIGKRFPRTSVLSNTKYALPVTILCMMPNILADVNIVRTNSAYVSSPVGFYDSIIKLPQYPTIYSYPWSIMGRWVRDSVPPDAVIASPSKQLAILIGDRKVLELNPGLAGPAFEKALRDNAVQYLLTETRWENMKYYEFLMSESRRLRFDSAYAVGNLHLLKVNSVLRGNSGLALPPPGITAADTSGAAGLLRYGRQKMLEGNYREAAELFNRGAQVVPGQPEFIYHAVLAYTFLQDSMAAKKSYERLLVFPQASSYMYLARVHMEAMDVALSAKNTPPTQERAIKMNDLARLYWDLGYPRFAKSFADSSLQFDSTYFWGLLWGFHFNFQLGDTQNARVYYDKVAKIDEKNQVVVSFKRLMTINDSLRWSDESRRSQLHLSAARIYRLIELFEESIDEAERAREADPNNEEVLQFLGEAFEQKEALRSAKMYYDHVLKISPENSFIAAKRDSIQSVLSRR